MLEKKNELEESVVIPHFSASPLLLTSLQHPQAMPSEVTVNGLPPLCFPQAFLSKHILMSYHMHPAHVSKNPTTIVSSIAYRHFPFLIYLVQFFTTVSSVFHHCFRSYFYSFISNSKSHLLFVLA